MHRSWESNRAIGYSWRAKKRSNKGQLEADLGKHKGKYLSSESASSAYVEGGRFQPPEARETCHKHGSSLTLLRNFTYWVLQCVYGYGYGHTLAMATITALPTQWGHNIKTLTIGTTPYYLLCVETLQSRLFLFEFPKMIVGETR